MRLIDADAVMNKTEHIYEEMGVDMHGIWNKQLAEILKFADEEEIRLFLHSVLKTISDAPTIDIVRCKECKKLRDCRGDDWERDVIESGYIGWCNRTSRFGEADYVKADDFCSYGEREGE